MADTITTNGAAAAQSSISKSDFRSAFWRSFVLMGSFNYERMQSSVSCIAS